MQIPLHPLYVLAAKVGAALQRKKQKLITVESCTGGGLAYWTTAIPGSSKWFEKGFVTYSNEAKLSLGVNSTTLEKYGPVSKEVAIEMAQKVLTYSSQISIAITGIAGPTSENDLPIGTVWIAYAHGKEAQAKYYLLQGDRNEIREEAISLALNALILML